MAAKDFDRIAREILDNVGGKDNVTNAVHCMTRLRINLKDYDKINQDGVKAIKGVLGAQMVGGQYQVIIGQTVPNVYKEFCALTGIKETGAIDENLDEGPKGPLTFKSVVDKCLDAITGSLTPILPILIVAGLIKMIIAILGPTMLGVVNEGDNLYSILNLAGDAGFYFLPMYVSVSAARKFGANQWIAMLIAGIMLHPTMTGWVTEGTPMTVYGIPMTLVNYSSSVFPMILSIFVMSYVEKFFKKVVPEQVSTMFVPLGTVLVMLPLALCVVGPLGQILGNGISAGLLALHNILGPVGVAIIGSLFLLLVATGMHLAVISTALISFAQLGYDDTILVGSICGTYALIAIYLMYTLKAKDAEDRELGLSCFVSQALGGVGEPGIFGIIMRKPKALLIEMVAAFCGGLYAGLTHCALYLLGSANFMNAIVFANPNDPMGLVNGCIACGISFVVAVVLCLVLGFDGPLPFFGKKQAA